MFDLADVAIAHQFGGLAEFRPGALHAARLEHPVVLASRIDHRPTFLDSEREGFFAVDVLAGFGGFDGLHGVPMVGRGNDDRIDVLKGQQFPKIGVQRDVGILAELGIFFVVSLGALHHLLGLGLVHFTDGSNAGFPRADKGSS